MSIHGIEGTPAASAESTSTARSETPQTATPATQISKPALWTGRTLSTLAALFLLLDGVMKLLKPAPVVEGTIMLGYPESAITGIGVTLIICTILYVVPPTAILGAILLTGYLGGAIATHVRVESPLFTHILAPTYFAALVWGGLYLRDPGLRQLLPLRRRADRQH